MIKRIFLLAVFFSFLVSSTVWAASVIRDIEFKGNQKRSSNSLLQVISTKSGTTLSPESIRHDIQALYRLGDFKEIRVEKTNVSGGIRLTYFVEERSKVGRITFDGNKKVKEDKLRELVGLKVGTSIDADQVSEAVKKIQDHYSEEGYHVAEIDPEFKTLAASADQELAFHIREGSQVRVARVSFIGNKIFSDKELGAQLKTRDKGRFSWLTGRGKYQEEILKRDAAVLVYFYQNQGYLKVKVEAPQVSLSRDRRWINISFRITEGEKFKVKNVGVEGDILTTKEELNAKLVLKSGDYFSRKNVEEDLQLLAQVYGDQAYAFANINPNVQPNDEDKTVDIIYVIQKGPKVAIDRINISGNSITRDKVIRREILIKENTLYNESRLRQSRQRLEALGYFEEVNFATPRGSSDDRINLNVTVKEKPTGTFSIGAGFSSVENFIFTASVAKNNFFGYGIEGQLSTELSSKRQLFVLSFEDPYFLDTQWILSASGFRSVNVFTDFDRSSFGGSMTLGHRIFDHSVFRLGYQIEDVQVDDFRTAVPVVFGQNLSGLTSSVSTTLQYDTRNNRLFPTKGVFNSISAEFAGVGGDNEFLRVIENFRYYQPIWKSLVAKLNLTAGHITSLNNLPVPLFERFFLGGVNSLRGYSLRSVGPSVQIPSDPRGGDNRFVFGGNKELQANVELEFPLYEPAGLKFVTFFDSGNAFSEEENFSFDGLRSDYGFGIRWNSPLGPLRFEWGLPLNREAGDDPVLFNFTIGSFF